jgi:heat shock protein HtpX
MFGMGGAFISLALSKWTAKRLTGVEIISTPSDEREGWLLRTVSDLAQSAGIEMPEVGIYGSEDMNAFATGMRRDSSIELGSDHGEPLAIKDLC